MFGFDPNYTQTRNLPTEFWGYADVFNLSKPLRAKSGFEPETIAGEIAQSVASYCLFWGRWLAIPLETLRTYIHPDLVKDLEEELVRLQEAGYVSLWQVGRKKYVVPTEKFGDTFAS